jgi:hypothetical protein
MKHQFQNRCRIWWFGNPCMYFFLVCIYTYIYIYIYVHHIIPITYCVIDVLYDNLSFAIQKLIDELHVFFVLRTSKCQQVTLCCFWFASHLFRAAVRCVVVLSFCPWVVTSRPTMCEYRCTIIQKWIADGNMVLMFCSCLWRRQSVSRWHFAAFASQASFRGWISVIKYNDFINFRKCC